MKWIRKIALYLLSISFLLIVSAWSCVHFFGDDMKQYALEQLNEQLSAEVVVSEVGVSFWDQFPRASLHFIDIKISDPLQPDSLLAQAEDLYLAFSVSDFISGNYSIEKIALNNASLRLRVQSDGQANYHIWKTDTSTAKKNFGFDLEDLDLKNTRIAYSDEGVEFDLLAQVQRAKANGSLENKTLDLDIDLDAQMMHLGVGEFSYIQDKVLSGSSSLALQLDDKSGSISKADLALGATALSASGNYAIQSDGTLCNFEIELDDQPATEVIYSLPWGWKKHIKNLTLDGNVDLHATIAGLVGKTASPEINIALETSGIDLEEIETKRKLRNMEGEALWSYSSTKNDLVLKEWTAETEEGEITLDGRIIDLIHPNINMKAQGELALSDLTNYEALQDFDRLEGSCELDVHFRGAFAGWDKITKEDLNKAIITGRIDISDAALKWKTSPRAFENLQASLLLKDSDAAIESLTGNFGSSEFELEGFLRNIAPYLLIENQVLAVDAKLVSDEIRLDEWLADEEGNSSSEEQYELVFPEGVKVDFQLAVDKVSFREFEAANLSGVCTLDKGTLRINPVSFRTCDGDFQADLMLNNRSKKRFDIRCLANLNGINIQKLFAQFENFGQSFIRDDHLRGKAQAKVDFRGVMLPNLEIVQNAIVCEMDLDISDGELIGHESMGEIAAYLRENKLADMVVDINKLDNELKHIRFAHLRNHISIKDEVITIPDMQIESSAMTMNASGTHTFANVMDYSIDFQLRQIMKDKSRDQFGEIKDDGLSQRIFMSMTGPAENPSYGYDQLAAKENRKEKLAEEKQTFKEIVKSTFNKEDRPSLSERLGIKKKDEVNVSVEWEDTQNPSTETEQPKAKEPDVPTVPREKKRKSLKDWLKKDEDTKKESDKDWEDEDDF